jgi:hypothetical protein
MYESNHCAWCNAGISAPHATAHVEGDASIICCSEACAVNRKHANQSNYKALIPLCAAQLKQGISEVLADECYISMKPVSTTERIEAMESTLLQICEGKGMLPEDPILGVGVEGLAATLRLIGLQESGRETQHGVRLGEQRGALDLILCAEYDCEQTFHVFNFCAASAQDDADDWIRDLLND